MFEADSDLAREAGRKGGIASGVARQPAERRRRALVEKVLQSRNGAAQVRLLQLELADRFRDLEARELAVEMRERKARQADAQLCRLLDEIDEAKVELDELNAEWETRNAALVELEQTISRRANEANLEWSDDDAVATEAPEA